MSNKTRIAVIGAGISGLQTAYWLARSGLEVDVYEASARTGGCVCSEKIDGYCIEWGPNTVLETTPLVHEATDDLGLAGDRLYASIHATRRYIVRAGKLHALPESPLSLLSSGLFSWRAKLRLFAEPWIPRTPGADPTLEQFVSRRLGREFLQYAVNPFVAGVSGGTPEELSVRSAFPKLWNLEERYGSLIRGAIWTARERRRSGEIAKTKARMFSFSNGLEQWTQSLSGYLGNAIRLNTPIVRLLQRQDSLVLLDARGRKHAYHQVISALPADALARLLEVLAPAQAQKIAEIAYAPMAVAVVGFNIGQIGVPLDGFGFLVPAVEQRHILGCIWSSVIFPQKAPDGKVLLTVFVGGMRQPDLVSRSDAELRALILEDLGSLMRVSGSPELFALRRWPRAIPQYRVGYEAIQRCFDEVETSIPGFYIAGNIRRGISMADSVLCARSTVDRLLSALHKGRV